MSKPFIQIKNISKTFQGTKALENVNMDIKQGEIHALLGENGAGKSTLIKILTGAYSPDSGGEVIIEENSYSEIPLKEVENLGIAAVYQDLKLAPDVSLMENILLGNIPKRLGIFVNQKRAHDLSKKALKRAGATALHPTMKLKHLKMADQEIVAIARALLKNANLLILDEPTALLSDEEVKKMFVILKKLATQGVSILYITHRLEEVFQISDNVTVLRDGKKIWTKKTQTLSNKDLAQAISGEIISSNDVYEPSKITDDALTLKNLSNPPHYENISLNIKKGEVVGLFGLIGAGKSELLKGIFGEMLPKEGSILISGKEKLSKNPHNSIKEGIGFVAEDRSTEGIFPNLEIHKNVNSASYNKISRFGLVHTQVEKQWALNLMKGYNVKYNNLSDNIANLSGGNQQKIVVSKWDGVDLDVLLLDEPTAGIDVGARRDIFKASRKLADKGKCVFYCSSYLPELFEVCDRILVMKNGQLSGEFLRAEGFVETDIITAAI